MATKKKTEKPAPKTYKTVESLLRAKTRGEIRGVRIHEIQADHGQEYSIEFRKGSAVLLTIDGEWLLRDYARRVGIPIA